MKIYPPYPDHFLPAAQRLPTHIDSHSAGCSASRTHTNQPASRGNHFRVNPIVNPRRNAASTR